MTPQLTLADALRYFFSPFLLYCYFSLYSQEDAIWLADKFGFAGMVAFLVAGCTIYFVYRFLIFNYVIKWLHDVFRTNTYRRFLQTKYKISPSRRWYPWHTARAERLLLAIKLDEASLQHTSTAVRYSGIHLLYQAGILALPFILIVSFEGRPLLALSFAGIAIAFFSAAILQDVLEEDAELAIIRNASKKVDEAAKFLGIESQTAS
jgi:hypothetical protein